MLSLFSITGYAQKGFDYQPIAMVNDSPITPLDITYREQFLRVINNIPDTLVLTAQDKDRILDDLIEEKIKASETNRFNIKIDHTRLEDALRAAAANLNISPKEFKRKLELRNLSADYFKKVTNNKMAWDELVQGRYGRDISINTYEIAQIIEANAATDGVSATYNLIKLPFDGSNEQYTQVQNTLKNISDRLQSGESFKQIALSYSNSEMMVINNLTDVEPALAQSLLVMGLNDVSQPIKTETHVLLAQLVDRQKGATSIINQRMLIKAGRLEFDDENSPQEKAVKIDKLNNTEDLCKNYDDYIDDVLIFDNTTIAELPKELRSVAKQADKGTIEIVREAKDSDYVLTICDVKKTDYYNDVPLAVRNKTRDQIFARKLELKANEYYRDLKKSAVITILK